MAREVAAGPAGIDAILVYASRATSMTKAATEGESVAVFAYVIAGVVTCWAGSRRTGCCRGDGTASRHRSGGRAICSRKGSFQMSSRRG